MIETEPTSIRRAAEGRQYALSTRDAAVGHVSPGVFWAIWRDGANYALTNSGHLNQAFRDAAEWILLMGQAHDAAPPVCPHCGEVLA